MKKILSAEFLLREGLAEAAEAAEAVRPSYNDAVCLTAGLLNRELDEALGLVDGNRDYARNRLLGLFSFRPSYWYGTALDDVTEEVFDTLHETRAGVEFLRRLEESADPFCGALLGRIRERYWEGLADPFCGCRGATRLHSGRGPYCFE